MFLNESVDLAVLKKRAYNLRKLRDDRDAELKRR